MPLHEPARMSADVSDPGRALALWSSLEPLASGDSRRAALPVRATFVATVDGGITSEGTSAGLGTDMDATVFAAMRARAGLVLVGAATARREGYGPATVHPALAHLRPLPTPPATWLLARTLRAEDIEAVAQATSQAAAAEGSAPGTRGEMFLVCSEEGADPERRAAAAEAGVRVRIVPGGASGFLRGALALAQSESEREINVEGGPRILASLLAEDLLDELVLTVSPVLPYPAERHLLPDGPSGPGESWRRRLRAVSAFTADDGGLYTRWIVEKNAP